MNIYGRDYTCFSGQGKRPYNEDQTLCNVKGEGILNRVILAVADGMGGAHAGDYASEVIKDHLEKLGEDELSNDFRQTAEKVKNCIEAANNAIIEESKNIKEVSKSSRMGTTVSGAVVIGNFCLFFNVGDSRTYLVKSNSIRQFTEDHVSKESRGLTRSVGNKCEVKVDIFPRDNFHTLENGDVIFSCTDGLWGTITDEEIRREISGHADIHKSLQILYDLALEKGSTDNISMAAYRFGNFIGQEIKLIESKKIIQIKKDFEQKKKAVLFAVCLIFIVILVWTLKITFNGDQENKSFPSNFNSQLNNAFSQSNTTENATKGVPIKTKSQNAKSSNKQDIGKSTSLPKEIQNIKPGIHSNFNPINLTDLDQDAQADILGKTKKFVMAIDGVSEIAETVKIRLIIDKSGNVNKVDFLSLYAEPQEKMALIKANLEAQIRNIRFTNPVDGDVIVGLNMNIAHMGKKIIMQQ